MVTKSFASDNNSGIHPAILKAIERANIGDVAGYGDDPYTGETLRKFREIFGPQVAVYLVMTGTAANVLGLKAVTDSCHSIICPETAHINVDEGGAPEKYTGCKLITVPTADGKLTASQIAEKLSALGNQHHNQPKVVSITQATELGTIYKVEEIGAIADFCHSHGLILHMDGARLANAAAALGVGLADISGKAGVDLLSFGGTKNGLMMGEAIIIFRPELAQNLQFIRKQGMQLASKTRFISAQFNALLSDGLWLQNAANANQMARVLATELAGVPRVKVTRPVEANAVFAVIPPEIIPKIQAKYPFYVWDEAISEARLMCSFDTTIEDIKNLVKAVREIVAID